MSLLLFSGSLSIPPPVPPDLDDGVSRVAGAYVRCLIGDRLGRVEAEVAPAIGTVLWRFNDIGQVKMRFTIRDPRFHKHLIRFGGRVLLQFSNGLPSWGGVFDPPERWTSDGGVEVTAYSAGYLLSQRRTAKQRRFINMTVGGILMGVMEEASATIETGVLLGSVWRGGDFHRVEYNYATLLDVVRKSLCSELSDADWEVRSIINRGYIEFYLELYERKGLMRPNVCLIDGHNAAIEYQRVGTIINHWYVAGSGSDWGSSRRIGFANDRQSISDYGQREGVRIESGVNNTLRLTNQATLLVEDSRNPRIQLGAVSVDMAPAAFIAYDIGDTIQVMVPYTGYSSAVQVVAREYDPASGMCKLVIEEGVWDERS